MPTELTSPQNPRVKFVQKLNKRRARDTARLTVVEGAREVSRALQAGIVPVDAYVCEPLLVDDARAAFARLEVLAAGDGTKLFTISPELFARLAYRNDSGGLLMTIPYLDTRLEGLAPGQPAFLALVEGVEKPGNLGAILRTADAAGVDGVIVCHAPGLPATDIHNPNVIRASLGTLFGVPVAEAATDDALAWLHSAGIRVIAASPDAGLLYTEADLSGPVALAWGSEAFGLSTALADAAHLHVRIPMYGMADSLNLATSAALLMYEVVRQRTQRQSARGSQL